MIIEVSQQELSLLYNRALASYGECISNKDNSYLEAEAGVPLNSIVAKGISVKFGFVLEIIDTYTAEVFLALYANDREIGKYVYYEDKTGAAVDDSLVLYQNAR